jgi:thioredoxin-dependent peroxiredoxin
MQVGDRFPVEELGLPERNGPLVVYFYPQAGTAGCTLEAHEFNRNLGRLEAAGVGLVGVSIDPEKANKAFAEDCKLDFPLVSDVGGELTNRLGLMKTYGDYGDMAARVTVLLDENGVVEELWRVDDIPSHVEEVVERSIRQR